MDFDKSRFAVDMQLRYTRWGWMIFPVNDMWVGGALAAYGEYSPMECNIITKLLYPGDVVIEGGVQIGAITLAMLSAIGATGRLVGFEPQPVFHMTAVMNAVLNGYGENCEIHNMGLGASSTTMRMPIYTYAVPGNYGGFDIKAHHAEHPNEGTPVDIVTIDSLRLDRCDFIKLDIEGMEKDALEGARETIERYHPTMTLECDRKDTGPALIEYVRSLGYTPHWIITPLYSADNFYKAPLKPEHITDYCAFNLLAYHPSRADRVMFTGLREAHATDEMSKAPGEWVINAMHPTERV